MSLELGILTVHAPSMCHEENVPDFQKPLATAMKQVSETIYSLKPDAIVIVSCHWMSSFHHFVDATPTHAGILTAVECPELITNVSYRYPGDEQLATELAESGKNAELQIVKVNDPTYIWDYGTLVPLRYLVPMEDIPIVDLSVTWAASLEETYKWGQQIGKVLRESSKRVVFVCSGALAHNLVRGRENMPTIAEQALDHQFIEYLEHGDLAKAWEMLPQYSKAAGVEAGGRHLALMLGVLADEFQGTFLGYGQSSGSGNVVMTFQEKSETQSLAG